MKLALTPVLFQRRRLLHAAALFAMSCGMAGASVPANAQIANASEAINKAGRQRMLSQRMAKCYFQLGLAVQNLRSQRILDESVTQFETQLADLKTYAPTPEIGDLYLRLEQKWLQYKTLLSKPPTAANGRQVLALSDEVLALAHQGTVALERQTGGTVAGLINIAGRQRMLSQRIAKLYQAVEWKVGDANALQEIQKARTEFSTALAVLKSSPKNTRAINEELELAEMQWTFFDKEIQSLTAPNLQSAPVNVATTSERILEVMDRITGMYEKLPR